MSKYKDTWSTNLEMITAMLLVFRILSTQVEAESQKLAETGF